MISVLCLSHVFACLQFCRIIFMNSGLSLTFCFQKYLALQRHLMSGSKFLVIMMSMKLCNNFTRYSIALLFLNHFFMLKNDILIFDNKLNYNICTLIKFTSISVSELYVGHSSCCICVGTEVRIRCYYMSWDALIKIYLCTELFAALIKIYLCGPLATLGSPALPS